MNDTNVGLGMVPHRANCSCDECRVEHLAGELAKVKAERDALSVVVWRLGGAPLFTNALIQ